MHDRIAGAAPECILALELNREVQALVENARERMRGIQPDGCQDRHQFGEEEIADPGFLLSVPRWPSQEADLLLCHGWNQHVIEQAVLLIDQFTHSPVDRGIDHLRRKPVRAGHRRLKRALFLQARHADFVELIQVAAEGTQRSQALEQRNGGIGRLLQDAAKELQLAEFAADVELVAIGQAILVRRDTRGPVLHGAGFVFHDSVPRRNLSRF
ncbi:hypothetical protein D9M72_333050 [compost metagenome]